MRKRDNRSWKITVPASTANLGAGFDSLGLALDLYLTVEATESECWQVTALSPELRVFPSDETHFIVQVAMDVAEKNGKSLHPCQLYVKSDIPLTRGLGSSAAAVVAGIELADASCGLNLTLKQKLGIATGYEGHPDNVGASLYGGFVVSCQTESGVGLLPLESSGIEIVTVIPKTELKTSDSRGVLPKEMAFKESVLAGSVANVLVAAFISGDWELAGRMMKEDRYHQPYRKKLLPHYEAVEQVASRYGAFGTALSGAGPTIACFVEKESAAWLWRQLQQAFPTMDVRKLTINSTGSTVNIKEADHTKVRPSSL
ncbi:homoserine kinase [Rossellomorea aquimaris]|uniref:homoserine kinase n=1 Tax=Rossellomorea aquimaris TaxID=189382 RepID=UPI001CD1B749|nr:homoserine kinase [Rossellomorea aquimaris]MCA1056038.1 homoserine kinase [Rossellomorea aquimaris]